LTRLPSMADHRSLFRGGRFDTVTLGLWRMIRRAGSVAEPAPVRAPASPLLAHSLSEAAHAILIALGTPEQLDGVRRHVGAT
jgi:hypothetical protein